MKTIGYARTSTLEQEAGLRVSCIQPKRLRDDRHNLDGI